MLGVADITPVALEWARQNVESNPHVAELIEVRSAAFSVDSSPSIVNDDEAGLRDIGPALPSKTNNLSDLVHTDENSDEVAPHIGPALPLLVKNPIAAVNIDENQSGPPLQTPESPPFASKETVIDSVDISPEEHPQLESAALNRGSICAHVDQVSSSMVISSNMQEELGPTFPSSAETSNSLKHIEACAEQRSHVLVGVVKEEERFDFCMCNPPFFSSMQEAGLNPWTACGGTEAEMVCVGGEEAFVARIIDDSVKLKHAIQ